ncbi:MAG: NCS2 family permease, partial [Acetivibrio sp.]
DMTNALPAFCTIVFMPFTYSIANGVAMGLITYCLIKLFTGKAKEIKPLTAAVAFIFIIRYAFMTLG